eukprot:IDg2603t1
MYRKVFDIVAGIEKSGGESSVVSSSDRRSKRRYMEASFFGGIYREARDQVVNLARADIMRQLTQNLTETRKQFYSSLLFLVDKISTFNSLSESKEARYYISFKDVSSGLTTNYFDGVSVHSVLDIPISSVEEVSSLNSDEFNNRAFFDMEAAHPWPTVQLHYPRMVKRKPTDEAQGRLDFENPSCALPETEYVSLHTEACLQGTLRKSCDLTRRKSEKLEMTWCEYVKRKEEIDEEKRAVEIRRQCEFERMQGSNDESRLLQNNEYDFDSWVGLAGKQEDTKAKRVYQCCN